MHVAKARIRSHSRKVENKIHKWFVHELWEQSRSLPLEEVDPHSVIDLDQNPWFSRETPTTGAVLEHMKRILSADLNFPIILHPDGSIMDGGHRVLKSILLEKTTVLAVRFSEAPQPSRIDDIDA